MRDMSEDEEGKGAGQYQQLMLCMIKHLPVGYAPYYAKNPIFQNATTFDKHQSRGEGITND